MSATMTAPSSIVEALPDHAEPFVVEHLSGNRGGHRYVVVACVNSDHDIAEEQIRLLGWGKVVRYAMEKFHLPENGVVHDASPGGTVKLVLDDKLQNLGPAIDAAMKAAFEGKPVSPQQTPAKTTFAMQFRLLQSTVF